MANKYAKLIEDLDVVLLDTRKTRPQLRDFENMLLESVVL